MMNWQDTIALVLVGLAGGYLLRGLWMAVFRKQRAGCGSCGDCSSDTKQVIPVESLLEPRDTP